LRWECEHRDDTVRQHGDPLGVFGPRIAEKSGDLDGGGSFDRFAARDGERAGLVRPRDATGALRAVETRPLRSAKSFVPELGVANVGVADGDEHLAGESEHVEPVMRERG